MLVVQGLWLIVRSLLPTCRHVRALRLVILSRVLSLFIYRQVYHREILELMQSYGNNETVLWRILQAMCAA